MTLKSYDLCGPNPHPMTVPEVDYLKELVKGINPRPIFVQIGADRGVSTMAILEERSDCVIFSIDIAECNGEKINVESAGLDVNKVIRVLGRSQDVGIYWPSTWQADFVLVDGDHSELGVRGDILTWLPKIKRGGIMVFHDYIPEPIPPEIHGRVVYAVDDLMSKQARMGCVERLIAFRIY